MKKVFLFLCLSAIMWRCDSKISSESQQSVTNQEKSNQTQQIVTQNSDNQSIEKTEITDKIKGLEIKNAADYDVDFIKNLRQQPLSNVVLDGNKFILEGDEAQFPEFPKMNKQTVLTAKKGNLSIAINVKRINQTTITYKIEMSETGKAVENFEGKATISTTSMFMGSESDENESNGISYEAYEYIDGKEDCFTSIRIGKDDETPYLLGRLIKNCNGKIEDIDLDFGMFTEK